MADHLLAATDSAGKQIVVMPLICMHFLGCITTECSANQLDCLERFGFFYFIPMRAAAREVRVEPLDVEERRAIE